MNLNYNDARALLDRAVEEKGADYVYPEGERENWGGRENLCSYYTKRGGEVVPSCIIGHVVDYLGLRKKFLAKREQYEGGPGTSILRTLGVPLTAKAEALLDEVQTQQDEGRPWGDAVDYADVIEDTTDDEVYR